MSHKVEVNLMGKAFSIRTDDQPEAVEAAANLVQEHVDELRELGSTVGSDRLITLAAMNLAGELLRKGETQVQNLDAILFALDEVVAQAEGIAKVPLR
ncbi:MAG: cell division protein ZapA [Mariprofundaceae bacterium]|nr:cell division protein ZapA [Mariprofundaceae bacterium]